MTVTLCHDLRHVDNERAVNGVPKALWGKAPSPLIVYTSAQKPTKG